MQLMLISLLSVICSSLTALLQDTLRRVRESLLGHGAERAEGGRQSSTGFEASGSSGSWYIVRWRVAEFVGHGHCSAVTDSAVGKCGSGPQRVVPNLGLSLTANPTDMEWRCLP